MSDYFSSQFDDFAGMPELQDIDLRLRQDGASWRAGNPSASNLKKWLHTRQFSHAPNNFEEKGDIFFLSQPDIVSAHNEPRIQPISTNPVSRRWIPFADVAALIAISAGFFMFFTLKPGNTPGASSIHTPTPTIGKITWQDPIASLQTGKGVTTDSQLNQKIDKETTTFFSGDSIFILIKTTKGVKIGDQFSVRWFLNDQDITNTLLGGKFEDKCCTVKISSDDAANTAEYYGTFSLGVPLNTDGHIIAQIFWNGKQVANVPLSVLANNI
jgi:hypothetical protein